MLRGGPNVVPLRPADAAETVAAWRTAIGRSTGPTALILTRQKLPALVRRADMSADTARGGYILHEPATAPVAIILSTGSEENVAMAAAATLEAEGTPTRGGAVASVDLFARPGPGWQVRRQPGARPYRG